MNASVDRTTTTVDDPLTLTLEITGDQKSLPEPKLPDLSAFEVYSSGRNQSFNWVNGQVSSSIRYNYILVPKKTGTLTIGPATMTVDGKTIRTAPITIDVTKRKPSRLPQQQPDQRGGGSSGGSSQPEGHKIFIEAVLDHDTVYVNQQVKLIFRLYRGEQLMSSPEYRPPSFNDFWKEDLPPNRKYYKTINGVRYDVTEIQFALFPISAGEKTIDPFSLTAMVPEERRRQRRDPFGFFDDDFFSAFRRGKPVTLTTKPLTLMVLPIPTENRPPNFSGLVGSFDITATYDRTTVAVNEPITATVQISGEGNIKSVTEPVIEAPDNFRVYNAGSQENVSKAGYQVSGSKTFEEVFVPRRAGTYELPGFSLNFYDPEKQAFAERTTDPLSVTVTPGEGEFSLPPPAADPEDIGYLAKDIRFLHEIDTPLARARGTASYWFFGLVHAVGIIGLAAVLVARRHRDRLSTDVAFRRGRYALRDANKRLARARKRLTTQDTAGFYAAIADAITEYLGDRLNRAGAGVTRGEIAAALTDAGIPQELITQCLALLDDCDQARFAPGTSADDAMERTFSQARDLLVAMDRVWQNKKSSRKRTGSGAL